MDNKYDVLKLENQLCFPLYAAAREVVKGYHPYLSKLDLTYTQYITLMVLWEHRKVSVKELGERLHLDSGTLTPLLKGLEKRGYITRRRSESDERVLLIELTEEGDALKDAAAEIPAKVGSCFKLTPEEAATLYKLLYKII
ncbi:MAG: MarR family transcriptional regulator [Lachnospiraceae bacterium]|nr:MarR family transcriptional regulator [Lachnospiraceae bacterium]